jgi:hypothetical protein
MDTSFEQKVRERAYHIWLADGMSDGRALDHWARAEHVVAMERGAPDQAGPPKKTAPAGASAVRTKTKAPVVAKTTLDRKAMPALKAAKPAAKPRGGRAARSEGVTPLD